MNPSIIHNYLGDRVYIQYVDARHQLDRYSAVDEKNREIFRYPGSDPYLFDKPRMNLLENRVEHPGEPGYYAHLMRAHQIANAFLSGKNLSIDVPLYLHLHRQASAYLPRTSSTLVEGVNPFRRGDLEWVGSHFHIRDFLGDQSSRKDLLDLGIECYNQKQVNTLFYYFEKFLSGEKDFICIANQARIEESVLVKLEKEKMDLAFGESIDLATMAKLKRVFCGKLRQFSSSVNRSLAPHVPQQKRKCLSLCCARPLVQFSDKGNGFIEISYPRLRQEILGKIVESIFREFRDSSKKITDIAKMFQKLEFVHPFPNGQGRTDILLLQLLLSLYGYIPAILTRPYLSSTAPLEIWIDALEEGMRTWAREAVPRGIEKGESSSREMQLVSHIAKIQWNHNETTTAQTKKTILIFLCAAFVLFALSVNPSAEIFMGG